MVNETTPEWRVWLQWLQLEGFQYPPRPQQFAHVIQALRRYEAENERLQRDFVEIRQLAEDAMNDREDLQRQLSQRDERIRELEAQVRHLESRLNRRQDGVVSLFGKSDKKSITFLTSVRKNITFFTNVKRNITFIRKAERNITFYNAQNFRVII